ncbi:MAG: tetratricopeptide repeat protein [Treponema sp.]|nr:tetratricopeptide repeat protein [Treponema sp.]
MKNRGISLLLIFLCGLSFGSGTLWAEPVNVLDLYKKGRDFQSDENYYQASQFYLEVVKANPAFSQVWYNLAECSYKLGEFTLAFQYLESAEKYEKKNSKIQNLKGMIYLALGEIEEGKKIFTEVLKSFPNDIDAHFGLAEIELYEGRFSGAEQEYLEALKRQNSNRKALLSMALVCAESGKFTQAERFMEQALSFYSGDAEVHYLCAVIYYMHGDLASAEKHARISLEVNGGYEKAYDLLSSIMFLQGDYNQVLDLCDFIISRNRNNTSAWYLKGLTYSKLDDVSNAIANWSTGLEIQPNDELMRSIMELEIRSNLPLSDSRRKNWAEYHLFNARQYADRYDGAGSVYEYQRALLLDPMNYEARSAYASQLELNGMYELFLDQLYFIKENNEDSLSEKAKIDLNDKIEAYESLLTDTLGKKWKVEPFYLDKSRWNIAVFYEETPSSFMHADSNKLVARSAADIFSGVAITSVKTQVTPVSGFGEAFNNARINGFDYFVILNLSEASEDLTLNSTLYSGRTGLEIQKNSFYGTGNNRFSTVLRRFRNSILEILPVRGKILQRNGKTLLVDLGRAERVVDGAEFKIIKKGQIRTADSEPGLVYKDKDVVGSLVITKAGEEISEASIKEHGFYDRINLDDEVVLISLPEEASDIAIDTVPAADEKGDSVKEESGKSLLDEIKQAVSHPAILDLLHDIY